MIENKVWITKKNHYKFRYLANWQNPYTGAMMFDWFYTLEDLKEYTASWGCEYVRVNF